MIYENCIERIFAELLFFNIKKNIWIFIFFYTEVHFMVEIQDCVESRPNSQNLQRDPYPLLLPHLQILEDTIFVTPIIMEEIKTNGSKKILVPILDENSIASQLILM